jgi:Raf kinase inhibitor-like YbhB/YbcL family protein
MKIKSPVFEHHQSIPVKYTCQGENVSPPLVFSDIPEGTQSLVLIVDDPDAPHGTFDHWTVWNLSPQLTLLPENASVNHQGLNHFGNMQYDGPCPPPGKPHRYFFKLYALNTQLDLNKGTIKEEIEKAMKGHIIDQVELIGTYQRK